VDIPSVLRLINTGVQIFVREIRILGQQRVDEFEIGSRCDLIDYTLQSLCHPRHCDRQDWCMGRYTCWIAVRWCCLYLQQVAGHRIQSQERIPLPFFTNNARKVVVRQNHLLFKAIPLPIQWTVANPLQLPQSPICKALPLQPR